MPPFLERIEFPILKISLVFPPNNLLHIHGAAKEIKQLTKFFLNLCLVPHSNAPTEGTFKKMLKGISLKLTLLKAWLGLKNKCKRDDNIKLIANKILDIKE